MNKATLEQTSRSGGASSGLTFVIAYISYYISLFEIGFDMCIVVLIENHHIVFLIYRSVTSY